VSVHLEEVAHLYTLIPISQRRFFGHHRVPPIEPFLLLFGQFLFPLYLLGFCQSSSLLERFFDVESKIIFKSFNDIKDSQLHLRDAVFTFFLSQLNRICSFIPLVPDHIHNPWDDFDERDDREESEEEQQHEKFNQ
jgi:hypothetical protein